MAANYQKRRAIDVFYDKNLHMLDATADFVAGWVWDVFRLKVGRTLIYEVRGMRQLRQQLDQQKPGNPQLVKAEVIVEPEPVKAEIKGSELLAIAKTWIQAPKDSTPIEFEEVWDLDGSTRKNDAKERFVKVMEHLLNYGLANKNEFAEISAMVKIGSNAEREVTTYRMSYNVFKHYISSSQTERGYNTRAKLHQAEEELQAIKAEALLKPQITFDPLDPVQLLQHYAKKTIELTAEVVEVKAIVADVSAKLAVAAPKAELIDQFEESGESIGFREMAKDLGANEERLREFLSKPKAAGGCGFWYRLNGKWVPYQEYGPTGQGLFWMKTVLDLGSKERKQIMITPKGQLAVRRLWNGVIGGGGTLLFV